MRRVVVALALVLVLVASLGCWSLAFADGPATTATPSPGAAAQWTAYGFSVVAPAAIWPSLELLHKQHFDWELASASQRPTPIVWADLRAGVFGEYDRAENVIRLSNALQASSIEARAGFLAHELTHLNDDLNGRLGDASGLSASGCYATEVRAFQNEANFWQMLFGPAGKVDADPIEARENAKMWAFVGNPAFTDLVVRTTPSYVRQCGAS